jgi:periplasmic protein TonB
MKRFFSVICFFFMMALPMNAQSESSTKVYYEVDEMPSFPGGLNGLMTFLAQNMVYPVTAQENGVQGRVTVSFVVETDGSITDVEVERSVDPFLDREAMRIVKAMPKWTPGKKDGKPVRVKYTVPVVFRLQ